MKKLNDFIGTHGQNGHCIGDSLTVADVVIAAYSSFVCSGFYDGVPKKWLAHFPNIFEVRRNVFNQPVLREYYDANKSTYRNYAYYPQPELKLTYFVVPGRGEAIRMALRL